MIVSPEIDMDCPQVSPPGMGMPSIAPPGTPQRSPVESTVPGSTILSPSGPMILSEQAEPGVAAIAFTTIRAKSNVNLISILFFVFISFLSFLFQGERFRETALQGERPICTLSLISFCRINPEL
jgi:hypothetical protein